MHISKFGIFWGKTSCCLCHIQMPSSLEVIWSWKNYCFWPDYSNNSFSLRGKSQFCGFERYVSVHLLSYIQVSTLLCICIWSFFFFFILMSHVTNSVEFLLLKVPDNNDVLAYWLSNTSTLLFLLQHTLKATGAASLTPQRRRTATASLFGRVSQVWSNHVNSYM